MIRTVLLIALGTTAAQADGFCDDIVQLQSQATITMPTTPSRQASCTAGQGLGGTAFVHCAIDFDFRAPAALEALEVITDALVSCPQTSREDFTDQKVNHPDSYTLRKFTQGAHEISLSLKDKGALQKTYVFLRVDN